MLASGRPAAPAVAAVRPPTCRTQRRSLEMRGCSGAVRGLDAGRTRRPPRVGRRVTDQAGGLKALRRPTVSVVAASRLVRSPWLDSSRRGAAAECWLGGGESVDAVARFSAAGGG